MAPPEESARGEGGADPLTPWAELPPERQTRLLDEYGHYNDRFPGTCDLNEKTRRFTEWLAARGVRYP